MVSSIDTLIGCILNTFQDINVRLIQKRRLSINQDIRNSKVFKSVQKAFNIRNIDKDRQSDNLSHETSISGGSGVHTVHLLKGLFSITKY